ncbi:MAG: hypothetical protein OXC10_15570 [Rhodospirillaceae bacterium]|nr:hypothetical protein [Rhodospirillaceae bacterium]
MNAAPTKRKKRSRSGPAKRRTGAKAGAAQARRLRTRAVFSIALSCFALPLAVAGLLVPLPAGLAAVLVALIALIAGRTQPWPRRIALVALILGVCGLAGGFVIGITVTAPA